MNQTQTSEDLFRLILELVLMTPEQLYEYFERQLLVYIEIQRAFFTNRFDQHVGQHGREVIDSVFLSKNPEDPERDETFTCYTVSIIYTRLEVLQGLLYLFGGKHSDMFSSLKHWSLRFECRDHDVLIDFGANSVTRKGTIGCSGYEKQPGHALFKVTIQPIGLQQILYDMRESGYWDSYSSYSRNCQHFVSAMVQEIFSEKYDCKIDVRSITAKAIELRDFDMESKNKFAILSSGSHTSSNSSNSSNSLDSSDSSSTPS